MDAPRQSRAACFSWVGDSRRSQVWDDPLKTDQEALDEALKAIDADPLEFFGFTADRPLN